MMVILGGFLVHSTILFLNMFLIYLPNFLLQEIRSAGVIIDPIERGSSPKKESVDVGSYVVKRRRQRLEKGSK